MKKNNNVLTVVSIILIACCLRATITGIGIATIVFGWLSGLNKIIDTRA